MTCRSPLRKFTLLITGMAALTAPSHPLAAQATTAAKPKFEVASVKLCNVDDGGEGRKGGGGGGVKWSPLRLEEQCQKVADLIRDAYFAYPEGKPLAAATPADPSATPGPPNHSCTGCGYGQLPVSNRTLWQPIEGSPAWVNSDRYTIDAKAEGPTTAEMMRGPMMQALLEDRFKLKIHRESKEVPVYELTVAKGGAKVEAHQDGNCIGRDKLIAAPPAKNLPRRMCGALGGPDVVGTTIAHFCANLSAISDRDVVDKTGFTGLVDLHLNLPPPDLPAEAAGPPTADEKAMRSLDEFVRYQHALTKVGLKLEPAKGSAEFLVIDYVERPSGN